ncbi:aldo/keto reductase [Mycetocola miduiensis]|uniref:Predicted oxidoreductase n=1 Tax=Mycetocola miduiensis TaxID=995034 RepID=A0A1I5AEK4_9MICO|nr:aldo/keto reductase [Mycetocola miduiensis]SFN60858.1 Predicted oxidoreductase [Mycetocola miduiensis]
MQFGTIPGVPVPVSRLVMGTAAMSIDARKDAFALLDEYVRLEGNTLDTAAIYGIDRSCERVVGEWITRSGIRDRLSIIAKGACSTSADPELVTSDLVRSLEELRIETADVYMMHRDNPSIPAGEFVEVMNEHVAAGRIRAIGGSNWLPHRIEEANAYAAEHGLVGFTVSSPNFSLALWNEATWTDCYSASDLPTRRWYEERDLSLFAWSSQASGFFTGRFDRADAVNPALADVVRVWFNDENFARRERAEETAAQRGVSATEIALAFVLSQRFSAFALIGPQTIDELRSSMAAADLVLTPEECAYVNLESDRCSTGWDSTAEFSGQRS